VKEYIIGVEVKGIYWHAEFAELRRSTWNSIIFYSYLHKVFVEFADFVARACPATAGAVLALTLRMAVVAKPTTKSAGFNLRMPVDNALIANKFCVFCVFCVKQNIIGTQTSRTNAEK
jgi:hypothetical protein